MVIDQLVLVLGHRAREDPGPGQQITRRSEEKGLDPVALARAAGLTVSEVVQAQVNFPEASPKVIQRIEEVLK